VLGCLHRVRVQSSRQILHSACPISVGQGLSAKLFKYSRALPLSREPRRRCFRQSSTQFPLLPRPGSQACIVHLSSSPSQPYLRQQRASPGQCLVVFDVQSFLESSSTALMPDTRSVSYFLQEISKPLGEARNWETHRQPCRGRSRSGSTENTPA
jgi:hypothetical protein